MKVDRAKGRVEFDKGIDAVRFLAFFLVFLVHFVYKGGNSIDVPTDTYSGHFLIRDLSKFGSEGVTIFFCLSAYLLSRLLILEQIKTKSISIRRFYVRRALRIWPLYFLYLFICLIISTVAKSEGIHRAELPWLGTFTYNWYQIITGQSRGLAAHLWSISIEEQIYLLLPVLLLYFTANRARSLALLLVAVGFLSKVVFALAEIQIYRNTFSYLDVVGIGILYAIYEIQIKKMFDRWRRYFIFFGGSATIIYVHLFSTTENNLFNIFSFSFTGILTIFLLLIFKHNNANTVPIWKRALAYLGRRSYGMYIYHWLILAIVVSRKMFYSDSQGISIVGVVFSLSLTILLSVVSYKFYEKPFLNFRRKYQVVESP